MSLFNLCSLRIDSRAERLVRRVGVDRIEVGQERRRGRRHGDVTHPRRRRVGRILFSSSSRCDQQKEQLHRTVCSRLGLMFSIIKKHFSEPNVDLTIINN